MSMGMVGVHSPLWSGLCLLGILSVVGIMERSLRLGKGTGGFDWDARSLLALLGIMRWGIGCMVTVSFAYWWVIIGRINPSELSALDAASVCVWVGLSMWVMGVMLPGVVIGKWPNQGPGWVQWGMRLTHWVRPLVGRWLVTDKPPAANRTRADEWMGLVENSASPNPLESEERQMIHRIMSLSDTVVREIMTPRSDAIGIDVAASMGEVKRMIVEQGHSRIPVYRGTLDTVVGFVYAKDLLAISELGHTESLQALIRPVVFIPETQSIESLLKVIRAQKTHLAIVVDEFGAMSGLVTLEDVIEEIVGEIQDEYDDETPDWIQLGDQHYQLDGAMAIDDVVERLSLPIPDSENYDTIGGFVLHEWGEVPAIGDVISVGSYELVVLDVSDNRIRKLECRPVSQTVNKEEVAGPLSDS